MASITSKSGIIKVGSSSADQAMGNVTSLSIDMTAETIDCTTITDTAKKYKAGVNGVSGSVEAFFDDDSAAQTLLTQGAGIKVLYQPEGSTSGDPQYGFDAIVTGISLAAAVEGMVTASISFQGTGAVDLTNVA